MEPSDDVKVRHYLQVRLACCVFVWMDIFIFLFPGVGYGISNSELSLVPFEVVGVTGSDPESELIKSSQKKLRNRFGGRPDYSFQDSLELEPSKGVLEGIPPLLEHWTLNIEHWILNSLFHGWEIKFSLQSMVYVANRLMSVLLRILDLKSHQISSFYSFYSMPFLRVQLIQIISI